MKHLPARISIAPIIGIIALFTLLGWFVRGYITSSTPRNTSASQQVTSTKESTPTESTREGTSPVLDSNFTAFVSTTIEARCPYYKPDGASYRDCLSAWEQELGNNLRDEQKDEVHAYCSTFTKTYAEETSLEGMELFLKCSIYKFQ